MPWTETTRPDYDRRFLRYASDSTDEEWELIAPFLSPPSRVGRPRTHSMRQIWNAISYIVATGCQWAINDQNELLAQLFGIQKVNKV